MINIWCTIENLTHDLDLFAVTQVEHYSNHESNNKNQQDKKEDGGCCDENASVFFVSIQALIPHFELNLTPNCNNFISITPVVVESSRNLYLDLFARIKPPPNVFSKFSNTRIFIQSFQI